MDTHVRILVIIHTNTFLIADRAYSKFAQLIKATEENDGTVPLCKDCSSTNDLSNLCK